MRGLTLSWTASGFVKCTTHSGRVDSMSSAMETVECQAEHNNARDQHDRLKLNACRFRDSVGAEFQLPSAWQIPLRQRHAPEHVFFMKTFTGPLESRPCDLLMKYGNSLLPTSSQAAEAKYHIDELTNISLISTSRRDIVLIYRCPSFAVSDPDTSYQPPPEFEQDQWSELPTETVKRPCLTTGKDQEI